MTQFIDVGGGQYVNLAKVNRCEILPADNGGWCMKFYFPDTTTTGCVQETFAETRSEFLYRLTQEPT